MGSDDEQVKGNVDRSWDSFERELSEMRKAVEAYFGEASAWYQNKKRYYRRLFQISGVSIIVFSGIVTLLSASDKPEMRSAIGVLGVLISSITGINTFFRAEQTWHAFSRSQFDLEYLLRLWDVAVAEARGCEDPLKGSEIVREATKETLSNARRIRTAETTDFFRLVNAKPK
jgi:hypothetical protein